MDILNKVSAKRFEEIDSFLAFLSIYEDKEREKAYLRLLSDNAASIRGAVCVEAGSGLGVMSAKMATLGARKVYAVEANPELFQLSKERLARFPAVEVVHADIRDFDPPEPVAVLVHEFYGQLLYDEDLNVLSSLKFSPRLVLPDSGALLCGLADSDDWEDEVIDASVVKRFDSVIVSGLFDETDMRAPDIEVVSWSAKAGLSAPWKVDLAGRAGDLVYFGIEVRHGKTLVCRSALCDNWSYGWTWRKADRFRLSFAEPGRRGPVPRQPEALFEWLR
jgi:hypothetical protein